MKVLLVPVTALILLVILSTPAMAFNPQPEPPALTNKLDSIGNVLDGVEARFDRLLSHPPDPGKVTNGAIGKLNAMSIQLGVLIEQLGIIDDNIPADDENVLAAALRVRAGAQAIIDDNRNHPPPDDGRIIEAIASVVGNAQTIVAIIDDNLPSPGNEIPGGGPG